MIEVAALTEGGEVAEPVIVPVPVDMCYSEDNFGSCFWMWFIIMSTTPFTFVTCSMEPYQSADQGPLGMVFGVVDGHFF
jgi:hypothetical protein